MSYIGNSPATSTEVADNAITLAKMASGTDGNLITYDASGDPAYVTTGTSGQVLTSGGTGVAPTFQTAAGGGKVLQVKHSFFTTQSSYTTNAWNDVSGFSITFDSNLTAGSKVYVLLNVMVSTHAGACYGVASWFDVEQGGTRRGDANYGMTSANRDTDNTLGLSSATGNVLFTPSTTTTPTIQVQHKASCGHYLNRLTSSGNASSSSASSITIMEIGA